MYECDMVCVGTEEPVGVEKSVQQKRANMRAIKALSKMMSKDGSDHGL